MLGSSSSKELVSRNKALVFKLILGAELFGFQDEIVYRISISEYKDAAFRKKG